MHERHGKDIFIATYSVAERDDGSRFSLAAWTESVETLLPKVECISFCSLVAGEPQPTAHVPWERVQQIVGHLITPTDHYPERFHVTDFPTEEQLAELASTA